MIAYIKGKVLSRNNSYLLLQSGMLGYKVFAKSSLLFSVKEADELELFVHHFIKEDKSELYGFESAQEMEFFELLISVSGVGPKSALSILELDTLKNIKSAIAQGDENYLSQVSGIGKKTAKKLILDLQDKLEKNSGQSSQDYGELLDALEALGYKKNEIKRVIKEIDREKNLQNQIKDALKLLSKI